MSLKFGRSNGYNYRMKFDVWICRPTQQFMPTSWQSNPPEVILISELVTNEELFEARAAARGFNEAELESSLGLWALVVVAGAGAPNMITRVKSNFSPEQNPSYMTNPLTPSQQDIVTYKHFVVCATLGLQQQADEFMRQHRGRINRVAAQLRSIMPPPLNLLYRGLLIEPEAVLGDKITGKYQAAEYASFTEDLDAACWFAGTKTYISQEAIKTIPKAIGWIATSTPKVADILFHHTWQTHLNAEHPNLFLVVAKAIAPQAKADPNNFVYQLQWNLKSQKEVILKPPSVLHVKRASAMNCLPDQELDEKFIPRPDWVMMHEDIPQVGITKGQKIYIKGMKFVRPARTCPTCGQAAITTMYILERGLKSYNCTSCGSKLTSSTRLKPGDS